MKPVSNEEIKILIEGAIPDAQVDIQGDGYKYFVTVISDNFINKNTLQRHKMIYAILNDHIKNGTLHALTLKTHTREEWKTPT